MIKVLFLVFVIPSLFGFYFAYNSGVVYPPFVNVDYLLLLLVLAGATRFIKGFPAAAFALVGVIVIAAIQAIAAIGGLFVSDLGALLDYFGFVQEWPWRVFLPFILGGVIVLACYYLLLRKVDFQLRPVWVPAALLAVVMGLDLLGAANPLKMDKMLEANVATSSAVELLHLSSRLLNPVPWDPTPIDSPLKQRLVEGDAPAHILSVSAEAWGQMQDEAFNRQIEAGLVQLIGDTYVIQRQTRPSLTGTINGEFRELCGLTIMSMPSVEQAAGVREHCLPNVLAERGWKTAGLHGNSGLFYDRRRIYPAIGFQNVLFREDFDRLETTPCRSIGFTGWCDPVVLRHGLEQLASAPRSFVHVMSLDTHLPLKATEEEKARCSASPGEACIYVHRFGRTLENIARAINEAPVKPDIVFIWGDHPPPYIHKDVRDLFVSGEVPMLILTRNKPQST